MELARKCKRSHLARKVERALAAGIAKIEIKILDLCREIAGDLGFDAAPAGPAPFAFADIGEMADARLRMCHIGIEPTVHAPAGEIEK